MKKQQGFIASILVLIVFILLILWAATNYIIPQAAEKCHQRYGKDWEVTFQGDFMCKNAQGDLKSIR